MRHDTAFRPIPPAEALDPKREQWAVQYAQILAHRNPGQPYDSCLREARGLLAHAVSI